MATPIRFAMLWVLARIAAPTDLEHYHPPYIPQQRQMTASPRSSSCGLLPPTSRIINGSPTGDQRWPWMAALMLKRSAPAAAPVAAIEFICGSVLVSQRHLLTAAHCLTAVESVRQLQVWLGVDDLEHAAATHSVEQSALKLDVMWKVAHPQYRDGPDYDIGLIFLDQPVTYASAAAGVWPVAPICLPTASADELPPGLTGTLLGWGYHNRTHTSAVLRRAESVVIGADYCRQLEPSAYPQTNMICAVSVRERSACRGDSGGPLMSFSGPNGGGDYQWAADRYSVEGGRGGGGGGRAGGRAGGGRGVGGEGGGQEERWTVVGIVNVGGCQRSRPTAYANVANYIDFIQSAMAVGDMMIETTNTIY